MGQAQNVYVHFNKPVDNTYAVPGFDPAQQVDMRQKLLDFINGTSHTLEVMIYGFSDTSISNAIINRYNAGVQVRVVVDNGHYDDEGTLALRNAGITVIHDGFSSPSTGYQGSYSMHNKIIIRDASNYSSTSDDAVWTGTANFTGAGFDTQYNSALEIHDYETAQSYLAEFNEMWGSSGAVPNNNNSKFATHKTDNTSDAVAIDSDGTYNDRLFFIPPENPESEFVNAINSADHEIFFCIFSFTNDSIRQALEDRATAVPSLTVKGIFDNMQKNVSGGEFWELQGFFGNDDITTLGTSLTYALHHKYMVIDGLHPESDPVVIIGSTNWSTSGFTRNDENCLIIHSTSLPNLFAQEFAGRANEAGLSLPPPPSSRVEDWPIY